MNFDTTLILVWIGVLLFATITIYGLWWSLFCDRAKDQRRCPQCWHMVLDRFPFRCPECGYVTLFEKNLFRTRRRWGFAALTLCSLIIGTTWLRDQLVTRSWWSLFPDRIVILILPWSDDGETLREIPTYLASRLSRSDMSDANRLRLINQCASGDSLAPPGSVRWIEKYAGIADKIDSSFPGVDTDTATIHECEKAMNSMPPFLHLEAPTTWNSVEPLVAIVQVENWWPYASEIKLRVVGVNTIPLGASDMDRLKHEVWERANPAISNAEIGKPWKDSRGAPTLIPIHLGQISVGKYSGEILFEWESTLPATADSPIESNAKGVITIPISIDVLPTALALAPMSTPAIDELVKEAFGPGMLRWPTGRVRHAFSYLPYKTSSNELESVAFGMVVEALQDGVPRRRLHVWWRGGRGGSRTGWEIQLEDQEALDIAAQNGHWTMRIHGDESLARRTANSYSANPVTKWWSGSVEFPLVISERAGDRAAGRSDRGRVWVLQEPVDAAKGDAEKSKSK